MKVVNQVYPKWEQMVPRAEELWHAVGIAEYPSRAALHRIAASPEGMAIGVHRDARLEGPLLILTAGQILAVRG